MASDDLKALILTAWYAGRMSYVEALRRLLDFGVPLSDATKCLATPRTEQMERPDDGAS